MKKKLIYATIMVICLLSSFYLRCNNKNDSSYGTNSISDSLPSHYLLKPDQKYPYAEILNDTSQRKKGDTILKNYLNDTNKRETSEEWMNRYWQKR